MIRGGLFVRQYRALQDLSPKIRAFFRSATIWSFCFEFIKLFPPLFFMGVIDTLVKPGSPIDGRFVLLLLAGYFGSLLAMSIIDYFGALRINLRVSEAETDVATRVLGKLLALDVSYHERHNTGSSMSKLFKGATKLQELLWDMWNNVIPVIFQSIFTLAILLWVGSEIGIAFLFFVPMFLIIIRRGAIETQQMREEYYLHLDTFAGLASQSVANVRTVKDFSNEGLEMRKAGGALAKYRAAYDKRTRLGMRNFLTQEVLVAVARITTLALAVWLMINGEISAGSLVLVMTLSEKAYLNLSRLYRSYYRAQDAEPSIERFTRIQQAQVDVKDNPHSKKRVRDGKISFHHVSFAYDGTSRDAVRDVTFEIAPRTTVALVGRSGSGKSTLARLLLRHADVRKGTIAVDGAGVQDYSLAALRAAVGVVAQDVELFNESIHDNIAYGAPGASRAAVARAARMANAHEFIERLSQGYDTPVGERGVRLSGGQKQRIAIARALLRNPKILVFDEATSSLDAQAEREIHDAIFRLKGKITLIIIAHRFSTIEHADKIVLLEKGSVAEVGTHTQLVQKKGIFAKLRALQELGEVE
jgi:ATP-binding cassette subfamily B protein